MERAMNYIGSLPVFTYISQRTKIQPKFLALGTAILSVILVQNANLGPLFTNLILLLLPGRDALLELRSKTPRISELRKHVVVLLLFALSIVLDSLGLSRIIPLFSIIKLAFILWVRSSEHNASWAYDNILLHIPVEHNALNETIDRAGAKARQALNERVEIKKGSDSKHD